jgi:hypothetical protein
MGNFYVNHTVQIGDRKRVAAVLRRSKLVAFVSTVRNGCVVVAEEQAHTQRTAPIVRLAKLLSTETEAPVLAVLNHDDDYLALGAYVAGHEITDYSSEPTHICQDKETSLAGKAGKLCAAFGAPGAVSAVTAILEAPFRTYPLACERHLALVEALGLSDLAVGYGFGDLRQRPEEASEWLKVP